MTGEGLTYLERKRERVECRDCGKELVMGSLDIHGMTQNIKTKERWWNWTDAATGGRGGEPTTYRIEFPKGGERECPVEGCLGRARTRTAMKVHFWHRHVRDVVIILGEGNLPHPICPRCDILVPWRSLNGCHKTTAMYRSGADRKRRRLAKA